MLAFVVCGVQVGVAAVMSPQFWRPAPVASSAPSDPAVESRDNNPNVVGVSAEVAARPLRRIGVVLCGGNVDLERLPWQKE